MKYSKELKTKLCEIVRERSVTESIEKALHKVAEEAQIPYKTLKNWYYPNSYNKYRINKGWDHSSAGEKSVPVSDSEYYRRLLTINTQNDRKDDF